MPTLITNEISNKSWYIEEDSCFPNNREASAAPKDIFMECVVAVNKTVLVYLDTQLSYELAKNAVMIKT